MGTVCCQVTSASLWSVRVIVLVKQKHRNKISHVQQSSVKTGIANALGSFVIFCRIAASPVDDDDDESGKFCSPALTARNSNERASDTPW